jgi:hypothetical protein
VVTHTLISTAPLHDVAHKAGFRESFKPLLYKVTKEYTNGAIIHHAHRLGQLLELPDPSSAPFNRMTPHFSAIHDAPRLLHKRWPNRRTTCYKPDIADSDKL